MLACLIKVIHLIWERLRRNSDSSSKPTWVKSGWYARVASLTANRALQWALFHAAQVVFYTKTIALCVYRCHGASKCYIEIAIVSKNMPIFHCSWRRLLKKRPWSSLKPACFYLKPQQVLIWNVIHSPYVMMRWACLSSSMSPNSFFLLGKFQPIGQAESD